MSADNLLIYVRRISGNVRHRVIMLMSVILILFVSPAQTLYAENSGTTYLDGVTSRQIASVSELAEVSDSDINDGMTISELSWNDSDKSIVFSTSAGGLIKLDPFADPSSMQKTSFPVEQFSDVIGYKILDNKLLFVGRSNDGVNGTGQGLFNLFSYDFNQARIVQITNYSNLTSVSPFAYDWMPDGKVVYETTDQGYNPDNDSFSPSSKVWIANAIAGGSNDAKVIWVSNSTDTGFGSLDASPDGEKLSLSNRDGLFVFQMSNSKFTLVEPNSEFAKQSGMSSVANAKWANDSKSILYWHTDFDQNNSTQSRGLRPAVKETLLKVFTLDRNETMVITRIAALLPASELEPVAISSDGRYIAYAVLYGPGIDKADEAGIFLTDLGSHSIPEFPLFTPIAASIASLITILILIARWQPICRGC